MPRSEHLTIMFTDIVGFTARTSAQSRAENKALLREHDTLLLPIVRRYSGKRIKSIGDALLVVFRSATDAVRCGMAMQDAVFEHNRTRLRGQQITIRVALSLGDVRREKGDVFGEPVNIAARIESITPPEEIYFSQAVYLAMNKAEVPSEHVGRHELKGIPEALEIYRVPSYRSPSNQITEATTIDSLPFGGSHRYGRASLTGWRVAMRQAQRFGHELRQQPWPMLSRWWGLLSFAHKLRAIAIVGFVLAGAFGLGAALRGRAPLAEAEPALAQKHWTEVRALAQELLEDDEANAAAYLLLGHAAFGEDDRKAALALYTRALALDTTIAQDTRLVMNLIEALPAYVKPAQELLIKYPSKTAADALVVRAHRPGYWGRRRAIEVLETLGLTNQVDPLTSAQLDLREAPECLKRREAVWALQRLKDRNALPALREALADKKNTCLVDDTQRAIAEIDAL